VRGHLPVTAAAVPPFVGHSQLAIEFEHLRKVFFAENDTEADAFATLRAAREWAMFRTGVLGSGR
jgi:hypothetical protein